MPHAHSSSSCAACPEFWILQALQQAAQLYFVHPAVSLRRVKQASSRLLMAVWLILCSCTADGRLPDPDAHNRTQGLGQPARVPAPTS